MDRARHDWRSAIVLVFVLVLEIAVLTYTAFPESTVRAHGTVTLAPNHQACPESISYPPDNIVRLSLALDSRASRIAPSYRCFLAALTADLPRDPANLCRFKAENAAQARKGQPSVIMIGDSITESWLSASPQSRASGFINRGISNQTSREIRARFHQDILRLNPSVVHILVGTNDIAEIGRLFDRKQFDADILSIVDDAIHNDISVIIGSILPVRRYPWNLNLVPTPDIVSINKLLLGIFRKKNIRFDDYFSQVSSTSAYMANHVTNDGVHPNLNGYRLMTPLLLRVSREALKKCTKRFDNPGLLLMGMPCRRDMFRSWRHYAAWRYLPSSPFTLVSFRRNGWAFLSSSSCQAI